jgi:hypothetical protein
MHTELSSFLTDVWENREYIMYGPDDPSGPSVEERVYTMYAPIHGIKTDIKKADYQGGTDRIYPPRLSGWRVLRRDWAYVWQNRSTSDSTAYRVYLNAKLAYAPQLFQRILQTTAAPLDPALPPHQKPQVPDDTLLEGYRAQVKRGKFAHVVGAAKIALADAAFEGRPDVIVIYINDYGGQYAAEMLPRHIASWGTNLSNNDHPPTTRRIPAGISVGPEVSGTQWQVAGSFGQVRCHLIARAMIQAVTQVTTDDGPNAVPHPTTPTGSPKRLDFVQLVSEKFRHYGINPNAPWE